MTLDFSYQQYKLILDTIASSDYQVIKIEDLIQNKHLPEKFIVLRHDVDLDSFYQVKFAELENKYNIHTSYYFRFIDKTFKEEVINKVSQLGHEVGYHYEVLTKAKGDPVEAMKIFKEEQNVFKEKWNSLTVCPHGGSFIDTTDGYSLRNILKLIPKLITGKKVFSKYINFNMWEENHFEDFQIIGDAYSSVDFSDFLYLSDTGRSWDQRYKRLDRVDSDINPLFNIRTSDDIINIIKTGEVNKIYLLVHFEQWKDNFADWVTWYVSQIIRRIGKKIIFGMNPPTS